MTDDTPRPKSSCGSRASSPSTSRRTLYDVGEHLAGVLEIVPGPPELEREIAALMWDLREALGEPPPYDAARPESSRSSYVVG